MPTTHTTPTTSKTTTPPNPTNTKNTPETPSPKPKSTKPLKIATVISILIALCGIAFGTYGMIQSAQKDSQISNLTVQIKDENDTVTTVETPEVETTNNETIVTITETTELTGGPYIADGYFYVPKWGVKYKLSDNLVGYGYAVDQTSQGDSYGNYVVGLTALSVEDYDEHPQATYYNDIFSCSVVTVRTLEDSKKAWQGDIASEPSLQLVQFNGLNFVIHDIWRNSNCEDEFMAPTDTVAEQLTAILMNPEKI